MTGRRFGARGTPRLLWLALLLATGLLVQPLQRSARAQPAAQQTLAAFASHIGLRDVWEFVETVNALRTTGALPPRYVTKSSARQRGWRGGGLCTAWPGHMIGGDRFNNFGERLPAAGKPWFEADLDGNCEQRGPRRLVYSGDGRIFVTLDHYDSFTPVP